MKKSSLLAAALALGAPLVVSAAPARPAATAAAAQFDALGKAFIDDLVRLNPVQGTQLGDHRYDARLPDMSAAGRAARVTAAKATLAKLDRIPKAALSREQQVDAALLADTLKYAIWQDEVLRDWAWDPQTYQAAAGQSLYTLAARDFAPWPERLRAATARMEALPRLYEQMRQELVLARVPGIYAETVAKQNMGTLDIVQTMLAPHRNELSAADAARFDAAAKTLEAALKTQQAWLDNVLVPQAKGDFRLDPKLYDRKLAFAMNSPYSRAEIKARALQARDDARAEMYGLARRVLAGRAGAPPLPANPTPAQQQAAIEAALELSYAQRPARDGVMAKARETLASATAFVRAKNLMTMPDTPVKLIEVPKYMQGVAVAYCDPPGPLERHLDTFYMVSPIPASWSDAQATSFLREYNDYMIHELSVHEAVPGHYLQGWHANRFPSTLRAVLASGPYVEGWAVYAEQLMAEADYLNGDPLFKLTVLKMRLRSITNALLDIGIHTEGLTREAAMDMMMKGAFQQEREAAGKWTRAQLGSTQLPSYFVGYSEHMELRGEMQRRLGIKFDLRKYNDEVMSHGAPPVRYVRMLMTGAPIK